MRFFGPRGATTAPRPPPLLAGCWKTSSCAAVPALPASCAGAALLCAAALGMQSLPFRVLAWLFVVLRALHSAIQCTYNKVMHRYRAYAAGGWVLWAMWALIGWHALAR